MFLLLLLLQRPGFFATCSFEDSCSEFSCADGSADGLSDDAAVSMLQLRSVFRDGAGPSPYPALAEEQRRVLPEKGQGVSASEAPLLFVAIYTGPQYGSRRADIRASWLRHPLLAPGGPVAFRFVVGAVNPVDVSVADAFEAEVSQFRSQFLRLPIEDGYHQLTNKTFALFSWFAEQRPAPFLMKLDDDSFPHIEKLVNLLERQKQRYAYMGLFTECGEVEYTGKWAESCTEFNSSVYPLYAQGPGYILSAELVVEAARSAASDGRCLVNEDVSVGSWVRIVNASEATPVHVLPLSSTMNACSPGDFLSLNMNSSAFHCMWERWRQGRAVCCGDCKSQHFAFPNKGNSQHCPCGFKQTCASLPNIACGDTCWTLPKQGRLKRWQ